MSSVQFGKEGFVDFALSLLPSHSIKLGNWKEKSFSSDSFQNLLDVFLDLLKEEHPVPGLISSVCFTQDKMQNKVTLQHLPDVISIIVQQWLNIMPWKQHCCENVGGKMLLFCFFFTSLMTFMHNHWRSVSNMSPFVVIPRAVIYSLSHFGGRKSVHEDICSHALTHIHIRVTQLSSAEVKELFSLFRYVRWFQAGAPWPAAGCRTPSGGLLRDQTSRRCRCLIKTRFSLQVALWGFH